MIILLIARPSPGKLGDNVSLFFSSASLSFVSQSMNCSVFAVIKKYLANYEIIGVLVKVFVKTK